MKKRTEHVIVEQYYCAACDTKTRIRGDKSSFQATIFARSARCERCRRKVSHPSVYSFERDIA
jgi:hypothetical protein